MVELFSEEAEVVLYIYMYLTDNSLDTTVDHYKRALKGKEVEVVVLDEFTSLKTLVNDYVLCIRVEPEDRQTEVIVSVQRLVEE